MGLINLVGAFRTDGLWPRETLLRERKPDDAESEQLFESNRLSVER